MFTYMLSSHGLCLTMSLSSMNPCPLDLQKNRTVPSLTSSSMRPFMDTVRVRRVTMTSGSLNPGGTGDPGDIAMGDVILDNPR